MNIDAGDVLKIEDPRTGEIKYKITDYGIWDLRPHKHKFLTEYDTDICLICGRTRSQIKGK